jgi:hypothetical protein
MFLRNSDMKFFGPKEPSGFLAAIPREAQATVR